MKKIVNVIKVVFIIVFFIPVVVWGFLLTRDLDRLSIAKNGVQATATVTYFYSDTEIEGRPYFYVEYTFLDGDGNEHTGRTDTVYSLKKASTMETLQIKYNADTFDSVRADYDLSKAIYLYILPIFGLVSIGFIISIIVGSVRDKREKYILTNGVEREATLISARSTVSVNNIPYFQLVYTYTDEAGVLKQGKSRSVYNFYEANYFRSVVKFKIRVLGDKTAVSEVPREIGADVVMSGFSIHPTAAYELKPNENPTPTANEPRTFAPPPPPVDKKEATEKVSPYADDPYADIMSSKEKKTKYCTFCGAPLDKKSNKCPSCGAINFD